MKTARVFPRITNATPHDEYAFYDAPGMFLPPIDEVHISVAFTYDLPQAERLARQWEHIAPVRIGGPALDEPGGEFVPGMYLKPGYVITSRGCPNNCWFCQVPKREKGLRELEIKEGNIIQDDNLLACSDKHIKDVFAMLKRQRYGKPRFQGGLEAKLLKKWHCDLLKDSNAESIFFAYDTPDDREPLFEAGKMLYGAGMKIKSPLRAYVLIGYPKDTFEKAEKRLIDTIKAGFMPFAMLWKNEKGEEDRAWRKFQREWCRPIIVGKKIRDYFKPRKKARESK